MEKRTQRMEDMMAANLNQSVSHNPSTERNIESLDQQDRVSDHFVQPEQLREVVTDPMHGPIAIPASCFFELSNISATAQQWPPVYRRSDLV